jgi:hypothetical protein
MKPFLIFLFIVYCQCVNLRGDAEDDTTERKVPLINIMMDEPIRDQNEVRGIELTRRIEKQRIRELDQIQQQDLRNFNTLLNSQNQLMNTLNGMSDNFDKLLGQFKDKTTTTPTVPEVQSRFKQVNGIKDGPLNIHINSIF